MTLAINFDHDRTGPMKDGNHLAVIVESQPFVKGCLSVDSSGNKQKKVIFEGSLQKVLIILPLQCYQVLLLDGNFTFKHKTLSLKTFALKPAVPAIPGLLTAERNVRIPPTHNRLQNSFPTPDPEQHVQDDDTSDWKVIDASKIEQHLAACLESAAKANGIEEDWVSLDSENFDKSQRSYVEFCRQEIQFTGNANLIDYVIPPLSTCFLPDAARITFENGKIVPLDGIRINPAACRILQLLLTATYGSVLSWTIMNRYQLLKKNTMTFEDVKKALMGVATHVKITDLQDLFRDVHKEIKDRSMQCSSLLKEEEIVRLQKTRRFDTLDAAQIGILLKAFQTLPFDGIGMTILDALYQGKSRGLAVWEFDCFNHDTEIAKRLSYVDSVDKEQLQLSISEHVCKNIGYLELKLGMIIPMQTETNKRIYYCVANKLKDKKDGVICSLLAPINEAQENYSSDNPLVLHLNFRGTQWQPGRKDSYESLQRDLDSSGIGKTSFDAREEEIIEMLAAYLRSSTVPWIKIVINGHSLGGTDTQRTMRLLAKVLSQNPLPKGFEKIVAVDAFCHNSQAPEAELTALFARDLKALVKLKRNILFTITLVLFDTDPLQNYGDMYLGAQIESPLLAKFAVLAESKKLKYFAAHRLMAFVEPKDPCTLTFITANTAGDLLEKIYSRNYYWNTENNTWVEKAGKGLHWYGGTALKPLSHVVSSSLYYGFKFITVFTRTVSQPRSEEASIGWLNKKITVHPSSY